MNELGNLRPSQLIYTFGVGALLDLPNISVLVLGLDDWDTRNCDEIIEERLLTAIKKRLGSQMRQLFLPPISMDDAPNDPTAPAIGVPVATFPRWYRCPLCNTLATIDSGIFKLKQDRWRSDRTKYIHESCSKGQDPQSLPVRFLLACRGGHLTDFPWVQYVHSGKVACKPSRLTLREFGASGDASDIIVQCLDCNSEKRMADAFDREKFSIACPAHHPHLRLIEKDGCIQEAKTILLGASNSWFPMVLSALSIPSAEGKLGLLVEENWKDLKEVPSLEVARYVTAPSRMPQFADYKVEEIWAAIEKNKKELENEDESGEGLKDAEWRVLAEEQTPPVTKDFRVSRVNPPVGYEAFFEPTVLLERLREVRALLAFTRIESNGDFAEVALEEEVRQTPLSRKSPTWLPASEVRGEGIFLRFKEGMLQAWEQKAEVKKLEQEFLKSHIAWRAKRGIKPVDGGFPGIRLILLHSLSHALMRQIALECGYTSASVRERLFCRVPGTESIPMAGFLIYTAASDSEGTLGGLVHLGQSVTLGRQIAQALESIRICASDPLCAEHAPQQDGRGVHGACCHACLFAPETSCEKGNRYLDRNTLLPTFSEKSLEFFKGA